MIGCQGGKHGKMENKKVRRRTQSRMCMNFINNSFQQSYTTTSRKQERIPIRMCSADYVGKLRRVYLTSSQAAALWLKQGISPDKMLR